MEKFEKVVVLDAEVQAERIGTLLTHRGIPHVMRSYHDSAYGGIFQGMKGWGHIEAPKSFHDEILEIVEDINRHTSDSGSDGKGPAREDTN